MSKKKPWQMTREEFRRTIIMDEEIARRPEIEARMKAEEMEDQQGFEYSSGVRRQIIGAPNLASITLGALDARVAVAAKRHRRIVESALMNGMPVPSNVVAEYSDLKP